MRYRIRMEAYQRQLEILTTARRAAAEVITTRKRMELQIHQYEQALARPGEQRIKDLQAGRSDLAAEVETRLPVVGAQLGDLRNQGRQRAVRGGAADRGKAAAAAQGG